MAKLISNIALLVNTREEQQLLRGRDLARLPSVENAYLIIDGGHIAAFGPMANARFNFREFSEHYDAEGRMVLPSWCDSHTHLVFAGSRENEFVDKLKGLTYAEIAAKGGGIQHSARKLNDTSSAPLLPLIHNRF